jgi:hypothetical protein
MLRLRGVHYDVGTTTLEGGLTRELLPPDIVDHDMDTIAQGLHANAARITGRDVSRLALAGAAAARHGLEPWLSPVLPNGDAEATIAQLRETALVAERLRQQGHAAGLVVGCELSAFMAGIIPGEDTASRLDLLTDPMRLMEAVAAAGIDPQERFSEFIAEAAEVARTRFHGPLTYASGMWEDVDWQLFDLVGVDAYRDAGNRETYADNLRAYTQHGKTVVVTELGCATYQGADEKGALAWTAVDRTSQPRRLRQDVIRDEGLQARELGDLLDTLPSTGVEGAFVYTYVAPSYPSSDDAALDLDTASYSLVRSWPDGRTEPKQSFDAVATRFAEQR